MREATDQNVPWTDVLLASPLHIAHVARARADVGARTHEINGDACDRQRGSGLGVGKEGEVHAHCPWHQLCCAGADQPVSQGKTYLA